jgi:hypothetical protein
MELQKCGGCGAIADEIQRRHHPTSGNQNYSGEVTQAGRCWRVNQSQRTQSSAHAVSDNILGMHDHKYSEQIERMLDVMLCMPKSAWGLVLEKVEKKIGADALRRIILRAYEKSDLKRGVAILDREKKKQAQKEKQKPSQRRKRAPAA